MGPDDWRLANDYNDDIEIDVHNAAGEVVGTTLISHTKLRMMLDKRVHLTEAGYAALAVNGKTMLLAHFLGGKPPKGFVKDHKNQNKLDNRDENLHDVPPGHNTQNRRKQKNTTSQYRGVSFISNQQTANPWSSSIDKDGQRYSRRFATEKQAARWYDQMAVWLYGSNAQINGFLSPTEILERKQPKMGKTHKTRILPQNVYHKRDKYIVQFESPYYCKVFAKLEDAANAAKTERERVAALKTAARLNQPITRNADGVAFIILNSTLPLDEQFRALVDDNIWYELMQWHFCWRDHIPTAYPYGRVNKHTVRLHIYCWQLYHPNTDIPDGSIIAHKTSDRLDCRSSNLELRPIAQNIRKRLKRKRGVSQHRGVTKFKNVTNTPWQASIGVKNKQVYLGSFATEDEAFHIRQSVEVHLTEMESAGETDREKLIAGIEAHLATLKSQ